MYINTLIGYYFSHIIIGKMQFKEEIEYGVLSLGNIKRHF